jgi:hypothetical protein
VDVLANQSPDDGDPMEKMKTKITLDDNNLDLKCFNDKLKWSTGGCREAPEGVKALSDSIRPLALKQLIKTELGLGSKLLRNSALSFFDFMREKLQHQQERVRPGAPSGSYDRSARRKPSGELSKSS